VTEALQPGDVLTLTVASVYYSEEYSDISWPLLAGTPVYAQVDSANVNASYGAVLEDHEILGGPYDNNIGSTAVPSRGSGEPPNPFRIW